MVLEGVLGLFIGSFIGVVLQCPSVLLVIV